MSAFHTRGPIPLSGSSYVRREFEQRIVSELSADRWVLLLGPRQHGKTSGLIRVKENLQSSGYLTATVDLQGLPPCDSYEQIVEWVGRKVAVGAGEGTAEEPTGHGRRDLAHWLRLAVPADGAPLVVFIDEAGGIANDEYRNSFYGQIRAIANQRVEEPNGSVLKTLLFVFCGTFRPDSLVDERNSPFNVCETVRTEPLAVSDATALWSQCVDMPDEAVVTTAFDAVGGQPYLLQSLFSRASEVDPPDRVLAIDEGLSEFRTGADPHFEGLFGSVLADPALAQPVAAMATQGAIPNEPANAEYRHLETLGIARRDGDSLVITNRLYADIAGTSAQLAPSDQPAQPKAVLFALDEDLFSHMQSGELREVAYASYRGAVEAYRAGSYRLALAGFGASVEAVLIDFLAALSPPDLAAAVTPAGCQWNRHEDETRPITFRLVHLLKVASQVPAITAPVEVSDPVREWRNQLHPAVALENYRSEAMLEPEARMSSSLVCALIRDIRAL